MCVCVYVSYVCPCFSTCVYTSGISHTELQMFVGLWVCRFAVYSLLYAYPYCRTNRELSCAVSLATLSVFFALGIAANVTLGLLP